MRYIRYMLPTLALSKSGTVEDNIFLSACHTGSRYLQFVILALLCRNVKSTPVKNVTDWHFGADIFTFQLQFAETWALIGDNMV